jgi:Flp pilus assembly protein TadG
MVEFAIVATVMFPLIFGCLEFVRLHMMESIAEDAAYAAARHVMVPGATKDEATAKASQILNLLAARGAVIEIDAFDKDGNSQSDIADNTATVSVSITIPVSQNSFVLSVFTHNMSITSECSMRFESYDGYYDGSSSS